MADEIKDTTVANPLSGATTTRISSTYGKSNEDVLKEVNRMLDESRRRERYGRSLINQADTRAQTAAAQVEAIRKSTESLNKRIDNAKEAIKEANQEVSETRALLKEIDNLSKEEIKDAKKKIKEAKARAKQEKENLKTYQEQLEVNEKLGDSLAKQQVAEDARYKRLVEIYEQTKSDYKAQTQITDEYRNQLDVALIKSEIDADAIEAEKEHIDYVLATDKQHLKNLEEIEKNKRRILESDRFSDKEKQEAADTLLDAEEERLRLEKEQERAAKEADDLLAQKRRQRLMGNLSQAAGSLKEGDIGAAVSSLSSSITVLNSSVSELGKGFSKYQSALEGMITSAMNTINSSAGAVTGALHGSGVSFSDLYDEIANGVATSQVVTQTKVLSELASIAQQGISKDLESISILSAIRDVSVNSFNVTDSNLRRLVRLNESKGNLTAKQFGLAAVLRDELNEVFGDSSYMGHLFQSMTGAVLDAVSANSLKGGTDSTNFYAVVETWMAGMYEAGVSDGLVNSIAQGINYLGSGNIGALSGNKALQNLMLLSMDRAGLDYASILQQGLSVTDTSKLLAEIIDYLADITDNTKENNVLQSSYANLFNMSITDLSAIKNLSQNSAFRNYANSSVSINNDVAAQLAINEVEDLNDRLYWSQKIANSTENMKFGFGASVATSELGTMLYEGYRLGNAVGDLLDNASGLIGKGFSSAVKKAANIAFAGAVGTGLKGLMNQLTNGLYVTSDYDYSAADGTTSSIYSIASTETSNTISRYLTSVLERGGNAGRYDTMTSVGATIGSSAGDVEAFKQFSSGTKSIAMTEDEFTNWINDKSQVEETVTDKILQELEKTLMKANEGEGYAFAVSLQGMSDGVLRSFASIFADEDAMMQTLTGKNKALMQNNTFIDYASDTSTAKSNKNTKTTPEFTP